MRELEHTIERTVVRGGTRPIERFDLESAPAKTSDVAASATAGAEELTDLLVRYRGHLAEVARELGTSIRTVQRRMKELNLQARDFRVSS